MTKILVADKLAQAGLDLLEIRLNGAQMAINLTYQCVKRLGTTIYITETETKRPSPASPAHPARPGPGGPEASAGDGSAA